MNRREAIPGGRERSVLSKKKRRGDDIDFDEDEFSKWVTGAHKRKLERQRIGHQQAADKIREEKNADRREQKQHMQQVVKQHFGDITIEEDGRVITSKTGYGEDSSSDDEPTTTILKRGKGGKVLHEEKHDSIKKVKSESIKGAQFSFNSTNKASDIAQKVQNKLLANLHGGKKAGKQQDEESEDDANTFTARQSLNFENADTIITVETTDMQGNLQEAIKLRQKRAQRQTAAAPATTATATNHRSEIADYDERISVNKGRNFGTQAPMGKRYTNRSLSVHAASESSESSDEEEPAQKTVLGKPVRVHKGKKSSLDSKDRKIDLNVDALMGQSEDEEEVDSELEDDEDDYAQYLADLDVDSDDSDDDNDDEDDEDDNDAQEKELSYEEKEKIRKAQIAQMKQEQKTKTQQRLQEINAILEREQAEREKTMQEQRALEFEQKQKEKEENAKDLTKKTKKQKTTDVETAKNRELVTLLTSELVDDNTVVGSAKPVSMAVASPYFMLPQPKAWLDEKERKDRLKAGAIAPMGSTMDDPAEWKNEKKRKLTSLEALQNDPTYGWEEGETQREKDLGDIFGIPAASMGGRHRKKLLSDKNKKKSSDARKEKKNAKKRDHDQKYFEMAFETGFADSNTKGSKITFDDDKDGDDFFDSQPQNSADRRKQKRKQETKINKLHQRGKMVKGKYFFGEKSGSVNL